MKLAQASTAERNAAFDVILRKLEGLIGQLPFFQNQARAKVRGRGEGFGETESGNCEGRNTIGMASPHEHLLTAIDVGSAKTCALVAEITDNGLRYRGHGVAESRGSRKGVIVDLDKAVSSIQ